MGGVVNGDRWVEERLAFLRGLLAGELPPEQRAVVELEIAALVGERGIGACGRRRSRWWRRR